MAFQAVPNVAQVRLEGVQDSQLTINDLYFEVSGGGITPTNLTTLATDSADWFTNVLAPILSDDWSAQRVTAFDLGVMNGAIITVGAATPGGVVGEALPNNVAACVSIRTAQRGRSGRGRNYVAGVPSTEVVLNTMSPTFMSDLLSAYNSLIGPGAFVAGWQQVIVSRRTLGALRPAGIAIPVISASFTKPYVSSMRSREVGHGA